MTPAGVNLCFLESQKRGHLAAEAQRLRSFREVFGTTEQLGERVRMGRASIPQGLKGLRKSA
jgi:hypothetical protein